MAVSTTTFEQRIARINKAQEVTFTGVAKKSGGRARSKSSIFTFPFFVGVTILTGGAAYAWAATTPEYQWVLAFAG
ncbi:hypothetical protein [Sulfitobacter sp. MF3-043]|uniref:hypothetical protein n=1 Tax=Sulfitobacter sediminivivens TaxID=3252902 RepID=UPI0036DE61C0